MERASSSQGDRLLWRVAIRGADFIGIAVVIRYSLGFRFREELFTMMRVLNKILVIFVVLLGALALTSSAIASLAYTFTSGTEVAVTGSNYTASGTLNLSLGFAPSPGTNLTVVKNTGLSFIRGTFDGVPQGSMVSLTYNGATYNYIANYYGGNGRSFVLQCPDVRLAAWGNNDFGQLGNGTILDSPVPKPVDSEGALTGKTVVAASGGRCYSLALTADGQIFAWGWNYRGQLGNNSLINSSVPVAVYQSGALAGKTVVAIAAGGEHGLALTADGQVFAWGANSYGQLGNNSTTDSLVPVAVTTSGALAGKTVVAIAAGFGHSLALSSDGQVFAWGWTANSLVPVGITSGALSGKTAIAIAAGMEHSLVISSDGQISAWGWNENGQLGNNSTATTSVPVAVTTSGLLAGKKAIAIAGGDRHSLALTSDGQIFAWGINNNGELGNSGTVSSLVPVAVSTSGDLAGKTVASIAGGASHSLALTSDGQVFAWGYNCGGSLGNSGTSSSSVPVATTTNGAMAATAISGGGYYSLALTGAWSPYVTSDPISQSRGSGGNVTFTASVVGCPVPMAQWQVSTTGTAGPFSNITDNPSAQTGTLSLGNITRAQDGYAYRAVFSNAVGSCTTNSAILSVPPTVNNLQATFASGTDIALTIHDGICVSGALSLQLGFAPVPGTNLTVINNTGLSFIAGTFDGVPQGGKISLTYNGITYNFVANYYGGNGRSLVLQWACVGLAAWGADNEGQLGNSGTTDSPIPVAVNTSGLLAGKTVMATAAGSEHSLVLTSDGQVFAWGYDGYGALGNSSDGISYVPVAVTTAGVLGGKTVVAIAAGCSYSLALTSDGQVFAWGINNSGELGINSNVSSSFAPVAVSTRGVLAGKVVVAIAAGNSHSLALTSDGQIFAWGSGWAGQLGNSGTCNSFEPVAVDMNGALSGKRVTAVSAGASHSLALTSDGQVFAWGSLVGSSVPVAVGTDGEMAGKTIAAIKAGQSHSLALTSDGQIFAWGANSYGQLGDNSTAYKFAPVAVDTSNLTGKKIIKISAGFNHNLALTSEGQVFAWGWNIYGQLGNSGTANSSVPIPVNSDSVSNYPAVEFAAGFNHSLALFASGPPVVSVNPESKTVMSGSKVSFRAAATVFPPATIQWQVSTTGTSGPFTNITDNVTATTGTLTLAGVSTAQNGYAYRTVFTNDAGSTTTDAATLTAINGQDLAAVFNSAADIPIQTESVIVSGSLNVQLGFAPTPGTNLMVVKNTGPAFITGRFSNAPQGGVVSLTFNGNSYNFVVNYYGGNGRSLVLQWACTGLDAWGSNSYGQLGNNGTTASLVPTAVNTSGALMGKTVVSVAGGNYHSLALTSDGRVFTWGHNNNGQLGNASTTDSLVPVAVNGALAGKTVVAIASGGDHCLALTSEGQVFAWGLNVYGQLGNGCTTNSPVPVAVSAVGAMAGKTVVAVAAGYYHSLALTSDGQVYAWGNGSCGQLGYNLSKNSSVPVAVITSGVLVGKTVVAIAGGYEHSLAVTSDGLVFAWGYNYNGQLGNNSTTDSPVPVAVTGALAGKKMVAVAAGCEHSSYSLALASDGQVFAWGMNSSGQLGNNSFTSSPLPVMVSTSGGLAGKTVVTIEGGGNHSLVLTSDGKVFGWGYNSSGQLGNNKTGVSSIPVAASTGGAVVMAVAAGDSHSLAVIGSGPPSAPSTPVIQSITSGSTVTITAAAANDNPTPAVQWQVSTTGTAGTFSNIVGNPSATTGTLTLTNVTSAQSGYAYRAIFTNNAGSTTTPAATLTLVNGPDLYASYNSVTNVPLTVSGNLYVSGSLPIVLGFAPAPGTNLTVINNTGPSFLWGKFSNIPQGGTISLTYNGATYNFVANYFGGNGRSLVLQWPYTQMAAWGTNSSGQLGNSNTNFGKVPVAVTTNGALADKTVFAVAGGGSHTLALTSDGQVFAWGINSFGQLGNNGLGNNSSVPVAVDASGVLDGKVVVAVAGGGSHSLALTSDGQVFAWGADSYGQLGNNSTTDKSVPVAVTTVGALAGKSVVAIAGGGSHSLALTSDGQVFTWGFNNSGQLGNNSITNSSVPVLVNVSGKTVVAIAAGYSHSLALTSDGQVFAWGLNSSGQLGNNSITNSTVPVAVNISVPLAGKKVAAIAAGYYHSLALTTDGQVVAWGMNSNGQLGNNSQTSYTVPVATISSGVLSGKAVTAISAGGSHSLALTSDGQVFSWGSSGQLGNNGQTDSFVPVAVATAGTSGTGSFLPGKTTALDAGGYHSLALFGSAPQSPSVTANPTNQTVSYGAIFSLTAAATGVPSPKIQWQVNTTGPGGTFTNIADNATATTGTLTNIVASQNGYAYRAVFTSRVGTCTSDAAVVTVLYPAPVLTVPDSITVNGTTKDGAAVFYNVSASDSLDGTLTPSCSVPSGSTFPMGTTAVNCSATNSHGGSTTGSFTVTVLRTFSAFQDEYGVSDEPTADPNHTGVCNLAAYAFGVNPSAPDRSQLPSASVQNGYLQITYPQWMNAADLTYLVEVSSDLVTWYSGASNTIQVSASLDINDATRQWVVVRDLTPISNVPRRFIRVKIMH